MADQVLKDKRGATIGRISTASNGVQTIKEARGATKGTYDPKTKQDQGCTRRYRWDWESTDDASLAIRCSDLLCVNLQDSWKPTDRFMGGDHCSYPLI